MKQVFIFLFLMISVLAVGQSKKYYTSRFSSDSPKIDGILNDSAWTFVEWAGDFTQFEPANGAKPSQRTRFKIVYDDDYLYVAIRAFDSVPGEIVKRMSRRDGFEGDFVEINIDSYHDYLTAYSFTATVAGVKADEKVTSNGFVWDDSWDPIWYLKTSIDKKGWVAEMKIPLSQLRFSSDSVQVWGLEVKRRIYRKDERSLWQAIDNRGQGYVSRFGELHGIKNLKPKKQFDLTPYAVGSYEHYKKIEGSPFHSGADWNPRFGADAKIGLSNNITMDLTINPDFGQVEADPSEVNLTAFETYFDEKRPFFIEGRNVYQFPLEPGDGENNNGLFYSRRVGRSPQYYPDFDYVKMPESTKILGAAKVTGKTKNGLSIGILESVTNAEKAEVMNEGGTEEKRIVEPLTNYFVARLDQELNDGNTVVGGMLTSTNRFINNDYLNTLPTNALSGGLNLNHSWNDRKYNLFVKVFGSRVSGDSLSMMRLQTSSRRYYQRPDMISPRMDSNRKYLSGHGGNISFGRFVHSGWSYMAWVSWLSPGLELNDIGYLRNADQITQILWTGYTSPQPVGILRSYNFNMGQWNAWNFDGMHINSGANSHLTLKFTNYWSYRMGVYWNSNDKSAYLLRGGPIFIIPYKMHYWARISTDDRKKLSFEFSFSHNRGASSSARTSDLDFGIIYRPSDRLKISLEPYYGVNHNSIQYVSTEKYHGKDEYFLAEINQETFMFQFRIDFSFTPDLSLQYYGQPFISSGKYSNFKRVSNPRAKVFQDRFEEVETDEDYGVDLGGDGQADIYLFNPDFKYVFFQSNMVLRWEYLPGSTVFVVWSQSRENGDYEQKHLPFQLDMDMNRMFRIFPHDIFLVKWSYRIPI